MFLIWFCLSASIDGRVYIWKITEGPDEEDKPQITGKIVIAVQIVGEGESVHPRVCWHCHKQVSTSLSIWVLFSSVDVVLNFSYVLFNRKFSWLESGDTF